MPMFPFQDVPDDDQPSDWEREQARRALASPALDLREHWLVRALRMVLRRWRPW